ncbi:hypothetical protein [Eel River basin pequenovirus]|nr:hypothetical protein [Eel River basin pequenovirus]
MYTECNALYINCNAPFLVFCYFSLCYIHHYLSNYIMKLPFKLTPNRVAILLTLIDYKIHEQKYYSAFVPDAMTRDKYIRSLKQMATELALTIDDRDHDSFLMSNVHLVGYFMLVPDSDQVFHDPKDRIEFAKERLEKLANALPGDGAPI